MTRSSKMLAAVSFAGLLAALAAIAALPHSGPAYAQPIDAVSAPQDAPDAAPASEVEPRAELPEAPALAGSVDATSTQAVPSAALPDQPDVGGVIELFRSARYLAGFAGALFLLVALIHRLAWRPKSGWAKKLLAGSLAFVSTGGLSVYATGAVGLDVAVVSVLAGLIAAGLNDWVKDLTAPPKIADAATGEDLLDG